MRSSGKRIGFIPTMGALHEGHLALVESAAARGMVPVVSVFVNPRQFNQSEDFEKYPRLPEQDAEKLEHAGCAVLFRPETSVVYPAGNSIPALDLGRMENLFEGHFRPGHFRGVVEVLYQLFGMVRPDAAFFGAKDYQQCLVVRRIIEAWFPETELVICPTIRESDGLAMSSRNLRLDAVSRQLAVRFPDALKSIVESFHSGISCHAAESRAAETLNEAGLEVEYLKVADARTLEPLNDWNPEGQNVVLGAVYLGGVRLIDNMVF